MNLVRASRLQLLDLDGAGLAIELEPRWRDRLGTAIRHPTLTWRLFVEGAGRQVAWDGWATGEAAVLQEVGPPDRTFDVPFGPPALLPSTVGHLVGLGPRGRAGAGQALVGRAELRAALAAGAPIDGLGPVSTVWTLEWRPMAGHGDGLTVVDPGPGGPVWIARAVHEDSLLLDEAGSLDVWLRLSVLLRLTITAEARPPESGDAPTAATG